MNLERASGLLLHLTSLAGSHGSGTMGDEARRFIDFLQASGQSYWQILPLGPVRSHLGFSPYASPSTFAGNDALISLEKLVAEGLLTVNELRSSHFEGNADFIDFGPLLEFRRALLEKAGSRFLGQSGQKTKKEYTEFCSENADWLDDYALFASLAEHFGTDEWLCWPPPIRRREADALSHWRKQCAHACTQVQIIQFLFIRQWREMKAYCQDRGIRLIGDLPFYVSLDSADTWAHPEIFQLDPKTGRPEAVAGVPPDYFSPTGQRWGNPLYRWRTRNGRLSSAPVGWWQRRLQHLLRLVDLVRIDHFRGFQAYWAVPPDEATAMRGSWMPGPGRDFFSALEKAMGPLPLIAEDLGLITPEVAELRRQLGLPGMEVLQFAFDGNPKNPYLPHNYEDPHCVVYTGTHDNNTTNGWFYGRETSEETKRYILDYLGSDQRQEFHWQLIRLALASTARLAIVPVQDILGYGEELRMNTPGRAEGNWRWKLAPGRLTPELASRLKHLTGLYSRLSSFQSPKH